MKGPYGTAKHLFELLRKEFRMDDNARGSSQEIFEERELANLIALPNGAARTAHGRGRHLLSLAPIEPPHGTDVGLFVFEPLQIVGRKEVVHHEIVKNTDPGIF